MVSRSNKCIITHLDKEFIPSLKFKFYSGPLGTHRSKYNENKKETLIGGGGGEGEKGECVCLPACNT